MPDATYSYEQISSAINRAADEVLDATGAHDIGLRDAVNLLVNATVGYLTGEASTLTEVVETHYDGDTTLDEILDRVSEGVH